MIEAFTFIQDFGLIIVILLFFAVYSYLNNSIIKSPRLALFITVIVMLLLVIPYDWFKILLFIILIGYGFFQTFKPWEWQ